MKQRSSMTRTIMSPLQRAGGLVRAGDGMGKDGLSLTYRDVCCPSPCTSSPLPNTLAPLLFCPLYLLIFWASVEKTTDRRLGEADFWTTNSSCGDEIFGWVMPKETWPRSSFGLERKQSEQTVRGRKGASLVHDIFKFRGVVIFGSTQLIRKSHLQKY